MEKFNICVVGAGYVGLVTGTCLAELGHHVVCVDSDPRKLKALRAKKIPIYEPGLDKLFYRNIKEGRLCFVGSVTEGMNHKGRRAQVVFIAVGTPPRADGSADLSAVEAVAEAVAKNMREYTVLVDKSTVPVETGEWVCKTVARFNKGAVPFDVVSNPEFLAEGTAVDDFLKPDRVVFGVTSPRAEALMRKVYAGIKAPVLVTDVKSAEIIKHASNSFLATKISYINAVAAVCEKVGADVALVAKGMGLDHRIGNMFLRPGLGFGGFCFPKDLEAFYWISKQKGYDFQLLKNVKDINEFAKTWVMRKVEENLWNLEGKTVALLGLAFKPNTDDMRFAPSVDIVRQLKDRGVRLRAYDPVAMPNAKALPAMKGVVFCRDPYDCAKGSDALALLTEWEEFRSLDLKRLRRVLRNPIILDGRNFYDAGQMRGAGFTYCSVGRP
ncbi:MAG TPA: UDP-glucose 6-dehydrogenase [Elusimicrobia bacterium]|nr:UDP-glucose 6-dehydrogenase [Elusimicrobiota bacterium]HBT62539.1 UDP-glucose 6-dehydrogenase [Elusimicrobiota bacterium]